MIEIPLVRGTATATPSQPKVGVGGPRRYEQIYDVNESERRFHWLPWNRLRPTGVAPPVGGRYVWVPTVTVREAAWLLECDRRLEELLELEQDWDSYGAAPPNRVAVSLAAKVLRALSKEGLPAPCINPSAEEGICMSYRAGSLYADVECFNSGEMLAATSDGEGERRVWEVDSRQPETIKTARLIRIFLSSRDT